MNPMELVTGALDRLGLIERPAPPQRPLRSARDRAIDALEDAYLAWREACFGLEHAYERWTAAEPGIRGLAFRVYEVALEHEERAARAYCRHVQLVRQRI